MILRAAYLGASAAAAGVAVLGCARLGEIRSSLPASLVLSGTLSPAAGGALLRAGTADGRPFYTSDGADLDNPAAVGTWVSVAYLAGDWAISVFIAGVLQTGGWSSAEPAVSPDRVTAWTPGGGATGTPVFTIG